MTILQSIILGIIQGLTEFLPISSSAHLVIVPYLLGWQIPPQQAFIYDVLVQVATLIAVIVYFWSDLMAIAQAFLVNIWRRTPFQDPQSRLGWYLILASLPAGLIGLAIKDLVEQAFDSPVATACFLFVTAGLLVAAERIGKRVRTLEQINWKDGLWMGFAQALAIFPGISRSGSTIAAGMSRDLERPAAARFSFLMSVPVMLAAGLLATKDLLELTGQPGGSDLNSLLLVFIPGFIASGVVGYLAIRWLLGYLIRHTLYVFAIYCTGLGVLTLVVSLIR
jgi:undecaprenyl-diphosphatase